MNKKKVCIAIHGLAYAGAERVASSWANYLTQQGHDVFVLVYACSEDTYSLDPRVRVIPVADTREAYFRMSKVKQLLGIRSIIRKEQPRLLISFLPKMQITMMLATLGMRLKRVETIRNNPWIDKDVEGRRFLWDLCFHRSDAIIVQTKEQSLYFSKKMRKKAVVISNPISPVFAQKQKAYCGDGIRKFVAVARINTQKNYPMMLRAFAKVAQKNPDCTLDVYGTGAPEAQQELQVLIDTLGMKDNIRLCGWQPDISDRLTTYDAFLMSSDYEGMPNALAEAMAMGLVCLSTDCKTGPKDMIDSGVNGFLAATGDEQSFADGILAITEMDLRQCAAMGAAARDKILHMCSEENTLARLKLLIESQV
jgi:glycosyltransferase involved in cell wall biosynthesis